MSPGGSAEPWKRLLTRGRPWDVLWWRAAREGEALAPLKSCGEEKTSNPENQLKVREEDLSAWVPSRREDKAALCRSCPRATLAPADGRTPLKTALSLWPLLPDPLTTPHGHRQPDKLHAPALADSIRCALPSTRHGLTLSERVRRRGPPDSGRPDTETAPPRAGRR